MSSIMFQKLKKTIRKFKHHLETKSGRHPRVLVDGKHEKLLVGWQEWCALPKLHLPAIKTKIDTGAKTSALHAEHIHTFHRHGELYVHFIVHPLQGTLRYARYCTAKVVDKRTIMSSNGHKESRYVIHTELWLEHQMHWGIDITLTNRDPLRFRMLLGRDALKTHTIIDAQKKMIQGHLTKRQLAMLYSGHH